MRWRGEALRLVCVWGLMSSVPAHNSVSVGQWIDGSIEGRLRAMVVVCQSQSKSSELGWGDTISLVPSLAPSVVG